MNEEIICPYCGEEQIFNGADSDVFFSEGDHEFACYECSSKFKVYTEAVYLYTTDDIRELE